MPPWKPFAPLRARCWPYPSLQTLPKSPQGGLWTRAVLTELGDALGCFMLYQAPSRTAWLWLCESPRDKNRAGSPPSTAHLLGCSPTLSQGVRAQNRPKDLPKTKIAPSEAVTPLTDFVTDYESTTKFSKFSL